jgi:2-iminobutanoate/2-iminopropanoate deaminase
MKNSIFIALLFLSAAGLAQTKSSNVKFINPPSVSTPTGYSHAAIIDLGNCKMVMISGQVPIDSQGNLIGKGDFAKQAEQVFINLKNVVTEAGGTMDNLVKTMVYITDIAQIQTFRNIRNRYVNSRNPPAATLAQVNKLFRDDVLIEMEAVAVIPKK